MTVQGQLLYMLETVAEAIGDDLRDRLVFVGGCTTALFITDPITLEDGLLSEVVDVAKKFAYRIDRSRIPAASAWTKEIARTIDGSELPVVRKVAGH